MRLYYGWYVVAATFVAVSVSMGLSYYNNPVFYPAYIDEFQWSRAVVAAGGGISLFTLGLLSPVVGMLADNQFGVKKIILIGIICDGVSKISFGLMTNLPLYYLTSLLLGVGLVCTSVLTTKLFITKWFKKKEGLALGIVIAGNAVGGGLGPILTSYLLAHYGWRQTHFMLSFLLWTVALPIFYLIAKERPQDIGLLPDGEMPQQASDRSSDGALDLERDEAARSTDLTFRMALSTPTFWLICSAILLFHICTISISQHFVLFLTDQGFSLASASAGLSIILLASIFGRAGFGALSDHYSKKGLIIGAYLLLSVMAFTLFLMNTPLLPSSARSPVLVYLLAALIGLGYGGGIVCVPILAGSCFGSSSLGKILGLIMFFNALGGTIGPVMVGHLFDLHGDYRQGFLVISLAAFAAVLCLCFIKLRLRVDFDRSSAETAAVKIA